MHTNGHDFASGNFSAIGALGPTHMYVLSVSAWQTSIVTSGPLAPCGLPVAAPQQSVSYVHLPLLKLSPFDCGFSHLPPVAPWAIGVTPSRSDSMALREVFLAPSFKATSVLY